MTPRLPSVFTIACIMLPSFLFAASDHPGQDPLTISMWSDLGAPAPLPLPQRMMSIATRRFALGIETGVVRYSGDVDNNSMFTNAESSWLPYVSLLYKYRMYTHRRQYVSLLLRTHTGLYPMRASSSRYSFTNLTFGGGVGMEMEFFLRSTVRPYAYFGLGVLSFHPKTSFTEDFSRKHPEQYRGNATVTGMFPAGIGLNIKLGMQADMNVQFSKTLTFTDNIDGWQSGIMDNFQTIGVGFLYYFR